MPKFGIFVRLLPVLITLTFASIGHADGEAAENPGQVNLSLDEAHHVWVVPNISLARFQLDEEGPLLSTGGFQANGVEFGARLISSSNRTRSILVGLDLRQILAQTQGQSSLNILGTKLGVRLEYRPPVRFSPGVGMTWFFGDTIVDHLHDIQFNGNTGSFFAAVNVGSARWFAQWAFGTYNEGPGFILLGRTPGPQTLAFQEFSCGVEFPIDFLWPEWLTMKPPGPSPAPR